MANNVIVEHDLGELDWLSEALDEYVENWENIPRDTKRGIEALQTKINSARRVMLSDVVLLKDDTLHLPCEGLRHAS